MALVLCGCPEPEDGDDGVDAPEQGETDGADSSDPTTDPGPGPSEPDDDSDGEPTPPDDDGETDGETDGGDTDGDTDTDGEGETDTDGEAEAEYAALIRGPLADPEGAQAYHDTLAAAGEEAAKMLGDFGHDAMLGADLLGATPSDFLGIDRWDNLDGANTFYGDPKFAEAFGALFGAPPSLELFELKEDWYGWGDLESGDSFENFAFVVIRGHLAAEDLEDAHAAHDALAAAGEEPAGMLGDVAHVVYLGVEDDHEFLAIDIWSDTTYLVDFYTNPEFAKAFGTLYSDQPTLQVYNSTDWYQW